MNAPRKIYLFALFATALLIAAPGSAVLADNIYKYQDENGIWHFTDRPPRDQDTDFEAIFMEREPEARVQLRQEGSKHNPVYLVFNDYWGPVQVEISLSDAVNVITEPELPARFVVPGQEELPLVGLGAMDERLGFQYRIGVVTVPGAPIEEPVDGLVVYPPIASTAAYPISQSFQGQSTHTSPENEYAVDIAMPVGTTVYAARGGRVMDIEEDFNQGGTNSKQFAHKANHVRILHDDGTMGVYAHLDLASALVRPGARVRDGQRIARSGNTGFSSGPHLHFVIQQNAGMRLISVPFRFRDEAGGHFVPEAGHYLRGVPIN
jgi:murein DD-endopeptidase MepM/ murein hydrolase activator NlpD